MTDIPSDVAIASEDLDRLRQAVHALEHPGLAARLSDMVGKPIELIGHALPTGAAEIVSAATSKAIGASLRVALLTMASAPRAASQLLHKGLAMAAGAAGGSLGLATLPFELPVSTIIMLRSIADIARSEGEDIRDPEAILSCMQVFALAGRSTASQTSESSYFAVRGVLAKSVNEAARYIAERGILEEGAPVLIRFIAQVASRFGVVVTQKVAAQSIPVIGALGGAAVNYAFIALFQDIARAHFTVRRLERKYGKDVVRAAYERVSREFQTSG